MTATTEDPSDDTEVVIGLFEPGVADDPHPAYARLRSECPVARGDLGGMPVAMISRYEDVQWALRHPDAFTSASGLQLGEQPLLPLEVDPPVHTDYRRILNPRFTPRAIATLEPEVRRLVRELLDGFAGRGSCDFHTELATPLPVGHLPRADGPPTRRPAAGSSSGVTTRSGRRSSLATSTGRSGSARRPGAPSATTSARPSPSGAAIPTTRCSRSSSTPTSAAGRSPRRSCSA